MNLVTRWSVARPWRTVQLWAVLVLVSMPLAFMLTSNLKAGGFTNPRGNAGPGFCRAFSGRKTL